MIAIAAGTITVVAIVLAFASGYLGEQWQWLRPAGELLLLAELVGLIVLERRQLFEPVHETVGGISTRVDDIHATLQTVTQQLGSAGQSTLYGSPHELISALVRTLRQTLSRAHTGPQILRSARLLGHYTAIQNDPEFTADIQSWVDAYAAFEQVPGTRADSPSRRWSVRRILAVADAAALDFVADGAHRVGERGAMNNEIKVLVRPRVESILSPSLITDTDTIIVFDDRIAALRWGLHFQGQQHATLFARWFDDLWASIPDSYLIFNRNGVDEKALGRIRKELEIAEDVPKQVAHGSTK